MAGKPFDRRKFIGSAAAVSVAFTILPRHVLGGKGFVAPSDKLTLTYIGCGTQGIREMNELLKNPSIRRYLDRCIPEQNAIVREVFCWRVQLQKQFYWVVWRFVRVSACLR